MTDTTDPSTHPQYIPFMHAYAGMTAAREALVRALEDRSSVMAQGTMAAATINMEQETLRLERKLIEHQRAMCEGLPSDWTERVRNATPCEVCGASHAMGTCNDA
tara:strand:- start:1199 stop:1513 length:315 start_codon:yes stop_codon:yes gene_type:complete